LNSLDQFETLLWLQTYLPGRVSGVPFYFQQAPDSDDGTGSVAPPYGVIQHNRTQALYLNGPQRVWSEDVWVIYIVTAGSSLSQLATLNNQLATALESKADIVTPNHATIKMTQFQMPYFPPPFQEPGGNEIYRAAGGLWKIVIAIP
jgi:hypothetical protein